MRIMFSFLIVGFLLAGTVTAGDVEIEPGQKYLMLSTTKTSTLQKELDQAAGQGFRIFMGGPTAETDMGVLMERTDAPGAYKYLLLATSKAGTMEKELNEAGAKGFKAIPSTITFKERMLGPAEMIIILERDPDETKCYEYKLFHATDKSVREKLMGELAEDYKIVGLAMTPFAGAQAIVEKESIKKAGGETAE